MATNETKMVSIMIPKTRTEKDDVYVAVNGRAWLIKRGETVKVPDYVAEVINESNRQLAEAISFQEEAQEKANF